MIFGPQCSLLTQVESGPGSQNLINTAGSFPVHSSSCARLDQSVMTIIMSADNTCSSQVDNGRERRRRSDYICYI